MPPVTQRRRGGQPGNRNAVKTGLYSRQVKTPAISEITSRDPGSIEQEVALLRIESRKLLQLVRETTTLDQRVELMRVLVVTSLAIDHLLRRPPRRFDRNVHELLVRFTQELEGDAQEEK